MLCGRCGGEHVVKNGSVKGMAKWLCRDCGFQSCRRGPRGKPEAVKLMAVVLYLNGMSMNAIAKLIGVSATSVMNWIRVYAERFGQRPEPEAGGAAVVSLDEMWHFVKKSPANSGSGRLVVVLPAGSSTGNAAVVIAPHSNG